MDKGPDSVLGELAVKEKLVSRDELQACLDAQRLAGNARPLGSVMVDMQLVTPQQLDRLVNLQKKKLDSDRQFPATVAELFGRLAAGKGYVTIEQVDECLAEQRKLEGQGQEMRLGQIMVRRRYMTAEQFIEVLKIQERMVRTCSGCSKTMVVGEGKDAVTQCRNCGQAWTARSESTHFLTAAAAARRESTPVLAQVAEASSPLALAPTSDQTLRRPTLAREIREGTRSSTPPSYRPPSGDSHPTPRTVSEGRGFGRYKLMEPIGTGGMGTVYKALDVPLNRLVALKLLRAADVPDPSYVMRFIRQAKTAARLNHPSIITIHEVGTLEDAQYFTMEYIDGAPLDNLLAKGRITRSQALDILEKVARAIDYAHSCGVIHGNLKPANVMVDRQNQPHITDFGMARDTTASESGTDSVAFYLAPEQIQANAEPADARTDIYAIGAMLYEVLTGELPFMGDSAPEVHTKILGDEPVRPRDLNAEVSQGLETICLKALEKDRRRRYSSALEFADDLRRHLKGEPIAAKPASFVTRSIRRVRRHKAGSAAAILIAALLVAGGIWYTNDLSRRNQEAQKKLAKERRDKAQPLFDDASRAAEKFLRDAKAANAEEYKTQAERHIKALDGVIEADPAFAEARALMARLLSATDRRDEAEKQLAAAAAADPASPAPDFERGRAKWRQFMLLRGRPLAYAGPFAEVLSFPETESEAAKRCREESVAAFKTYQEKSEKIDEKLQKTEERTMARAIIAFAEQRPDDTHEQAMELQRLLAGPREETALLKTLACSCLKGRYEEAIKNLDAAVHARPYPNEGLCATTPFSKSELEWAFGVISAEASKPHLLVQQGIFKVILGDMGAARGFFRQASSAGLFEGRERLCLLELGAGNSAAAADLLSQAPEATDPNRQLLLKNAVESSKPNTTPEAGRKLLEMAQDLVTKLPKDPFALYLRGKARLIMDDRDGAQRDATDALKVAQKFHQAYDLRAQAKIKLKDMLGAQMDIRSCKECRKDYLPIYLTACTLYRGENRGSDLKQEAEQGLKIFPKNLDLMLFKGYACLILKDFNLAAQVFEDILKISPTQLDAILEHGRALVLLGKPEAGWAELDAALKKYPSEWRTYEVRGLARIEARQWPEARPEFEKGLQVAPPDIKPKFRRYLEIVDSKLGPQWRQKLASANQFVNDPRTLTDPAIQMDFYTKGNAMFKEGWVLFDSRKPGELSQEDLRDIATWKYNYACTFAIMSTKKDLPEAEKETLAKQGIEWIEKSFMAGFDRMPAGTHDGHKEHTGLEHTKHDRDFNSYHDRADYKALLEKYTKTPSSQQEY